MDIISLKNEKIKYLLNKKSDKNRNKNQIV
jgi:hypothetical protein